MTELIDLHDVGVALGGRPVVRNIDLTVRPGEVVALLGANGSGKSTLVKATLGLLRASSGKIRLFGTPLDSFRDWGRVGYVPQRSTLSQGVPVTAQEVVASGRLALRRPLVPARRADREAVRTALEDVGLREKARHRVATLSGGQQQRVLIARALASAPDLLVLDEPNAGVDLHSQEAIAEVLLARAREGAGILVVLHELGPFTGQIERAVVLHEGRAVYDGAPDDSFASPHDHHHRPDPQVLRPAVHAPLEGPAREDDR